IPQKQTRYVQGFLVLRISKMIASPSGISSTMQNRVPKVTVDCWLIKLLAVTVGETAADYLALNLGFGLSSTSWIMAAFLGLALVLQFAQKKYVPCTYWLAVVLIS